MITKAERERFLRVQFAILDQERRACKLPWSEVKRRIREIMECAS